MAKGKYYWIKERYNPQLGTYFVLYDNSITVKEAKKMENALYGNNVMHKFNNKEEYEKVITELYLNKKTIRINPYN